MAVPTGSSIAEMENQVSETNDPLRFKKIFLAAMEVEDSTERNHLLDRECAGDSHIRVCVEALLRAHAQPPGIFDEPLARINASELWAARSGEWGVSNREVKSRSAPGSPLPTRKIGEIIDGRYKLRQLIGEGGMGAVYVAEQLHPIKRTVALKLIKDGMGSQQMLVRFEAERQALALMDHPNIAKVLDAGTVGSEQSRVGSEDDGTNPILPTPHSPHPTTPQPYFVMELVKGTPITEFCDGRTMNVPDRLELFRKVCLAVHHAHQKGIIHRDLKPSNILVELHDSKAVPKIIDFGMAKAYGGLTLTDQTLYSAMGFVAGTPLYMAPEQATFNAVDIDTRADIYSLGVILYELLTGVTPVARETLKQAALDDLLRTIREQDPKKPSHRISSSQAVASIAATRQTVPVKLGRFVRGELDWIVMKALEKERDRRYDSATAFAEDIGRFLNHDPILAARPTNVYRIKKFVRRNRGFTVAVAALALCLTAGIVGTSLGLFRALKAENAAQSAAQSERLAKEESQRRLKQVEKGIDLTTAIFVGLDPKAEARENRPLRAILGDRLAKASTDLEGESLGDELAVAKLQSRLGLAQLGLGYPQRAIELFQRARRTHERVLGPMHRDTLADASNLALGYEDAGKMELALPLFQETLRQTTASLGPDDDATLTGIGNLARAYRVVGKLDLALPLLEESYRRLKDRHGPIHPDTLTAMNNLAGGYRAVRKLDLALPLFQESVKLRREAYGVDHLDTLTALNNLATCLQTAGRLDEALPLFEEALKRMKVKLGADHGDTLMTAAVLGLNYKNRDRIEEAIPLLELAYRHRDKQTSLQGIGTPLLALYVRKGQWTEANALADEMSAEIRKRLSPSDPRLAAGLRQITTEMLKLAETQRRPIEQARLKAELEKWRQTPPLERGGKTK